MDVENPLHEENIPVAKMVCIEVMGQPVEDLARENISNSYCKSVVSCITNLMLCLMAIICLCGFLFYLFIFPF